MRLTDAQKLTIRIRFSTSKSPCLTFNLEENQNIGTHLVRVRKLAARTETPWDPIGDHLWSTAFPPMSTGGPRHSHRCPMVVHGIPTGGPRHSHRWTISGLPMLAATCRHDHRWSTGGH